MRYLSRSFLHSSFLSVILLIIGSSLSAVQAQDNLSKWEKFDFATGSVTLEQLKELNLDDLKFMRGLVFGRHGRIFKDAYIQSYLKERSWYKPNPKLSELSAQRRGATESGRNPRGRSRAA